MSHIDTMNQQPENTKQYLRVKWCINLLILIAILLALEYFFGKIIDDPYRYFAALILLIPLYVITIGAEIDYRKTRSGFYKTTIQMDKGMYRFKKSVIPIDHVQFVTIKRGLIMRRFKIARIVINTTGDIITLPFVEEDQALATAEEILGNLQVIHDVQR